MANRAKTKAIRTNAAREAERREIPKKKLEAFMAKKIGIDTKLNDQIDDLLIDFRKDIAVLMGGHLKLDPKQLEEALSEVSGKMKGILAESALLFAGIGDSAYKVIVHEALIKGLEIVKAISVEMNDLKDEMDEVKKQ